MRNYVLTALVSLVVGGLLVFGFSTLNSSSVQENDAKAAKTAVLGYLEALKKGDAKGVCSSFSQGTITSNWQSLKACVTYLKTEFAKGPQLDAKATFEVTTVAFFTGPIGTVAEVKVLYTPQGPPSYEPIYLIKENEGFKIELSS